MTNTSADGTVTTLDPNAIGADFDGETEHDDPVEEEE
jgi:hypothetical protein